MRPLYTLFLFLTLCLNIFFANAITPCYEKLALKELNLSEEEIDDIVNEALKTFNVPGASISLVFKDQTLFSKGYGLRDMATKLPVTENTLFPIASCTKAFTATLLAQLVDEGKVAFDDPVKKYIPEFYLVDEKRSEELTIRDLIAHRTGMARHDPIWYFSDLQKEKLLEILKNLEPACSLRENFQYNNLMYTVAAMVAEKVTGESWEALISSRLLNPLKMENSTTSLETLNEKVDFSSPHAELYGVLTEIPFRDPAVASPGGGLISNALEMANWIKVQLGEGLFGKEAIINPHTLKEMHIEQMPLSNPVFNEHITGYGLGWFLGNYRNLDLICHSGEIDGFSSDVALLAEKKVGLVILANSSSDGRYLVSAIRNQIFDKILNVYDINWKCKFYAIKNKVKRHQWDNLELLAKCWNTPCLEPLEIFNGSYTHPAYGTLEVKIEDDMLLAFFGKLATPLFYKMDNVFLGVCPELLIYGASPIIEFKFNKDVNGFIEMVEVPFEGFRSAKPITFRRS